MTDHTADESHRPRRRVTPDRAPRETVTEYRLEQLRREHPDASGEPEARRAQPTTERGSGGSSELERAAYVETAIQQAIRRGDFDNLPGAGKPLPGLDDRHDPDWWIRRKIQAEKLTGLGPPALMLRVEDRELDARLDALHRETDVRDAVEDFNRRVREARRQLLGGPPVITPTRDVEEAVAAWRERRDAAAAAVPTAPPPPRRPRAFRRRSSARRDSPHRD